ncbi:MAG: HDOD domain-containing protein [Syntrophobacter sp.]
MKEENLKRAKEIVKSIDLPPQPRVVLELYRIFKEPDPDTGRIIRLVSDDLALSAKLIKLANSPLLGGGRKIDSIRQAFMNLGSENFYGMVLTSALRDALAGQCDNKGLFDGFWNHCLQIAKVTELIVLKAPTVASMVPLNLAYLAGLFHDCAMPLLIKRYPEYISVFNSVLCNEPLCIETEESRFGTNHALISYFVSKSWQLPIPVCNAILNHHEAEPDDSCEVVARKLRSILILGEHLSPCDRNAAEEEISEEDLDGSLVGALNELYLSANQMPNLRREVQSISSRD